MRGRRLFQARSGHRLAQRADRLELSRAIGAARNMRIDVADMAGVELAVGERVQERFIIGAMCGDAHDDTDRDVPCGAACAAICTGAAAPFEEFHAARSIARARASRDITVPTGTPATSAIS